MTDSLAAAVRAASLTETAAVALAVVYLLLAVRQSLLCWFAALVSSLLYTGLFFEARLYMEAVLQVFYAAMAVYGWYQWRYGGERRAGVRISVWPLRRHAAALAGVAGFSALAGWGLAHTNAAFPYADSFTTVAAVLTTYMVACKILENWVYWFVIDSVSVYLYAQRELYLTALLFVLYLVLVVVGFGAWWREYRDGNVPAAQRERPESVP